MNCYCANYYGSIHCKNTVSNFGDRCKLCTVLKSGASLSDGLLPEDQQWYGNGGDSSSGSSSSNSSNEGRRDGRHGSSRAVRVESRRK